MGLVVGFLVIKIVVHTLLAQAFGVSIKERPLFAILIAQVGEFAFVLFTSAQQMQMLTTEQTAMLSAAVALSMAATRLCS